MSIEAGRDKQSSEAAGGTTAATGDEGTQAGASLNGQAALQTIDLSLGFGQRTILTGIGTDIRRGAVTALIGPTGSGKTTLLRTFNRMNDKVSGYRHAGDVLLDGRGIWSPGV